MMAEPVALRALVEAAADELMRRSFGADCLTGTAEQWNTYLEGLTDGRGEAAGRPVARPGGDAAGAEG